MLLRLMSTITVGLILFDLVNDSSPMGICGKILEWCKAFDILIDRFVKPLFAWIHLGWISVSSVEMHLLVIQGILGAGLALSEARKRINIVDAFISFVICVSLSLVLALLLPGLLGAVGAILGWLVPLGSAYEDEGASSEKNSVTTQSIAFCAVLACLLILLSHIFYAH